MRRRTRSRLALGVILALVTVLVPNAAHTDARFALLRVDHARAVDGPANVIWMLALGSDARKGQSTLRSRADSIHLVGVNTRTGHGTIVGLPRDSYVDIPGHGTGKINSSLTFGGPQLTARTVEQLAGVRLDYVFLTDFGGFAGMVHRLGFVRVRPPQPMSGLGHRFPARMQKLNGSQALGFSRIRYGLPRGDFDRSLNQGQVIRAGLRRVHDLADRPGMFEGLLLAALKRLHTDLRPTELYRLGRVMLTIHPAKVRNCVITGGTGSAGGASVVFLDRGALNRLMRDARRDATLRHGC
jgi:polyisoprenyl-teichoic acid--peptidoglycan teichoic acid transferase